MASITGSGSCRKAGFVLVVSLVAFVAASSGAASTTNDRAIAKSGLLRLGDFEAGWRATPAEPDDNATDKAMASIPECNRWRAMRAKARKFPHAGSPEFSKGEATARNEVFVFPTEAGARKAALEYASSRTQQCIELIMHNAVRESLQGDLEAAEQIKDIAVEVGRESVDPIGDEVVAYSFELIVTPKTGFTQRAYFETQAVRAGRVVSSFEFADDIGDFPLSDIAPGAMDASIARVETALDV